MFRRASGEDLPASHRHIDGEDFRPVPLIERKDRLAALLANAPLSLHYSDHQLGHGNGTCKAVSKDPQCRRQKSVRI
jgi:hypothetical protein